MGSLHKNIQIMLDFIKAIFLDLHFSYYTSMAFLMELYYLYLICNLAICADGTTFYSNCDQLSDLWQQLELAS